MNRKKISQEMPGVPLKLHGLDPDCDPASLARAADGLATLLEEMGTSAQREDPPAQTYDWRKDGGRS